MSQGCLDRSGVDTVMFGQGSSNCLSVVWKVVP